MTLREALTAASARLAAVSETPRLDAELLMAHALGVERDAMLLGGLDGEVPAGFNALIARRLANEPVAYIAGWRDFWTIRLRVTPDVLIPRPDSETLIEAAVGYFKSSPFTGRWQSEGLTEGGCELPDNGPLDTPLHRFAVPLSVNGEDLRVLDLGTGSGALLLAALDQWPDATGIGIDASEAAAAVARENAERIAPGRADIRVGNWADGLDEQFDLILCNPPYIEDKATLPPDVRDYEPVSALFAGADGLDCYREIIPTLPRLLASGGMIAVEIGSTQAEAVSALFSAAELSPEVRHDLAGRPRAIVHFALAKAPPHA